ILSMPWAFALDLSVDLYNGVFDVARIDAGQTVQTMNFAFEVAQQRRVEALVLRLGAGEYTGGRLSDRLADEVLPLRWEADAEEPFALKRLEIRGALEADPTATLIRVVASELGFLEVDLPVGSEPRAFRLTISGVTLRGGGRHISIDGSTADGAGEPAIGTALDIDISNCHFESAQGSVIEVAAGMAAESSIAVRDSSMVDCATALSVEALNDAAAEVVFARNVVRKVLAIEPSGALSGAIQLYAGRGSSLDAVILNSEIRDASTAIVCGAHERATELNCQIGGNLIYTSVEPPAGIFRSRFYALHALVLEVPRSVGGQIDWIHNTVFGVTGPVFRLREPDHPKLSVLVSNSVFWGDETRVLGSLPDAKALVMAPSNIAPRSSLAEANRAGVRTTDPGFADPASDDYSLRANSSALDLAQVATTDRLVALLSEHIDERADLAGNCRRSQVGSRGDTLSFPADLGAYEAPGDCAYEVFLRGDCDSNERQEVSDAIFTFRYLFLGGAQPLCQNACDSDDSGSLEISDGIYFLSYLFLGGAPPPAPSRDLGPDPTPDDLAACPYAL
ncbi:MAG: hypothetical protein AAF517_13965, partial [Planctomycetota bacterium]